MYSSNNKPFQTLIYLHFEPQYHKIQTISHHIILVMQLHKKRNITSLRARRQIKKREELITSTPLIISQNQEGSHIITSEIAKIKMNTIYYGDINYADTRDIENYKYKQQNHSNQKHQQHPTRAKVTRSLKRSNRAIFTTDSPEAKPHDRNLNYNQKNTNPNNQQSDSSEDKREVAPTLSVTQQIIKEEQSNTKLLHNSLNIQRIELPEDFQYIKHFFLSALQPNERYLCLVKVVNFSLRRTFMLYSDRLKLLLSAEMQPASIGCNCYFFIGQPKKKNDRTYIGKLRSNMSESLFTIYDKGLSTKQTDNPGMKRSMIGNVISSGNNKKKEIKVLVPRNGINDKLLKDKMKSLEDLRLKFPYSVVEMDCKQTSCKESPLTHQQERKREVQMIKTSRQEGICGRFVIECNQSKEALVVRKVQKDLNQVIIGAPFSILQAFGVSLSLLEMQKQS